VQPAKGYPGRCASTSALGELVSPGAVFRHRPCLRKLTAGRGNSRRERETITLVQTEPVQRFAVGAAVTTATLGLGFLPYLLAAPGRETKAELAATRRGVVDQRY
jgi:hypothetical protein